MKFLWSDLTPLPLLLVVAWSGWIYAETNVLVWQPEQRQQQQQQQQQPQKTTDEDAPAKPYGSAAFQARRNNHRSSASASLSSLHRSDDDGDGDTSDHSERKTVSRQLQQNNGSGNGNGSGNEDSLFTGGFFEGDGSGVHGGGNGNGSRPIVGGGMNMVNQDGILVYIGGSNAADKNESRSGGGDALSSSPDEYGRPLDETEDNSGGGIDCSRFQNLDDRPAVCRPNSENEGHNGGDDGIGVLPTDLEGFRPNPDFEHTNTTTTAPLNLVSVEFLVGLAKETSNMERMTEVASRVVTTVLDSLTPFEVYYFDMGARRQLEPLLLLDKKNEKALNPAVSYRYNIFEKEEDEETFASAKSITPRHPQDTRPSLLRKLYEDDAKKKRPPIQLMHAFTHVEPKIAGDMDDGTIWYWTQVDYGAFFKSESGSGTPPRPILNTGQLGNVTWLCQHTVNKTIENGIFVGFLALTIAQVEEEIRETGQDQVDDSLQVDEPISEVVGDFPLFVGVGMVGKAESASLLSDKEQKGIVYTEPLVLEFGMREWLGLGLFLLTVFVATILTSYAACIMRRQTSQEAWGAVFTESGMSSLLKVGWRYQEPDHDTPEAQLFLQVYDKTKLGYNEDNSVLQGGVEQEVIAATTTSPTSGATTLTPNGMLSSIVSSLNDQEHSHLDASAWSALTPENRSHQYEIQDKSSSSQVASSITMSTGSNRTSSSKSHRKKPSSERSKKSSKEAKKAKEEMQTSTKTADNHTDESVRRTDLPVQSDLANQQPMEATQAEGTPKRKKKKMVEAKVGDLELPKSAPQACSNPMTKEKTRTPKRLKSSTSLSLNNPKSKKVSSNAPKQKAKTVSGATTKLTRRSSPSKPKKTRAKARSIIGEGEDNSNQIDPSAGTESVGASGATALKTTKKKKTKNERQPDGGHEAP